MERLKSLDMSRGFAIATMVILNLLAVVLAEPAPFFLRLLGSVAAPLFIILSGFMVSLTSGKHNLRYFLLQRGAWILSVGIFIDIVVWQMYPLMSVEVLYLTGFSIPLAYLTTKIKSYQRLTLILLIITLTPILQRTLGYTYFPTEFYLLSGMPVYVVENQTGIINHWLIDGWYPIFPWLAFSIAGAELGERFKGQKPEAFNAILLYIGSALVIVGSVSFIFAHPQTFIRSTWSELFYPPTIQYAVLLAGICLLILRLFMTIQNRSLGIIFQPLSTMGKASLGIYFAHLFTIAYILTLITGGWWKLNLGYYLIAYVLLLITMWGIARIYQALGDRGKRWVGTVSRIIIVIVILAFAVAVIGKYIPPVEDTIRLITGFFS